MKIVYCAGSIRYIGGLELVTITKVNALADVEGNDVYLVLTDNNGEREMAPLSSKVTVIDLGINYYEDDWKSRLHVLKGIFVKRRLHKKRLKEFLNEIQPDVVVSVGLSEKYMLPSICHGGGNCVAVREIHNTKNYRFLASRSRFDRFLALMANWYDYSYKIWEYDQIVVLTHEDHKVNWNSNNHVSVIPNPIIKRNNLPSQVNVKKIIAVGRLAAQKNFSSLIRAFYGVVDKYPDWTLDIYGEGGERKNLEQLVDNLNLRNHVYLKGETLQVQEKMLEASCFVMSSKYEGFGLVLIEAMQCGLPVISYACPCGPKDIITDGKDGFLVPLNDEKALAEKICFLIEHPDIRAEMGKAALQKAEKYSVENIIPMWMDLFNKLVESKRKDEK